MVRAPCCEKLGLKRGPWTPEEDHILISYIQNHGHGNWRALPKQAGLLRCGKSCRLRWTNYLRPDIKRGNFSKEEEEAIIKLHEMLGNRWSAIAGRLPGRTDNEIKNVWNTHLKKRLKNYPDPKKFSITTSNCESNSPMQLQPENLNIQNNSPHYAALSPQQSSSEMSSITDSSAAATTSKNNNATIIKHEKMDSFDGTFWLDDIWSENPNMQSDDGMDFWYDLLIGAEDLPQLPEF